MDAEAWHQINAIASNTTPVQWTQLVDVGSHLTEYGPEHFLCDILERVKFFASCIEHEMPSRIPIDKFQHSEVSETFAQLDTRRRAYEAFLF